MKQTAKLKCNFSIGDSIGHVIIWLLLSVVTFGLALLVSPYYFVQAIVNETSVVAEDGVTILGKLNCEISLGRAIGNSFIWIVLIVFTVGLAYFVYLYRVVHIVLSETTIQYNNNEVSQQAAVKS